MCILAWPPPGLLASRVATEQEYGEGREALSRGVIWVQPSDHGGKPLEYRICESGMDSNQQPLCAIDGAHWAHSFLRKMCEVSNRPMISLMILRGSLLHPRSSVTWHLFRRIETRAQSVEAWNRNTGEAVGYEYYEQLFSSLQQTR